MPLPKNQRIYAIQNEILMKKCDFKENEIEGLDPSKLTQGSHIKAHFICPECKNKWIGSIRDAAKYNGCQLCMKKARSINNIKSKIMVKGSLFITNPELKKEWDYEENNKIELYPENVMAGTSKKAHWICPLNHKFEAYISNRALKHTGCPICIGQKVLKGFNDLETTRPDLLREWDYQKNDKIGITPQNVMKGSHVLVHWICPFGHEYTKQVKERCAGHGCTICAKESQTSFPEQAIFYYISKKFPDVKNRYGNPEIDIFIPTLNFGIEYDGLFAHKNKKDKEEIKDKAIKSKGINLLRIKEVIEEKNDDKNVIYCVSNSNNTFMNDVINKIEKIINTTYSLNVKFKPNIEKDRIIIEKQYFSLRKENSIVDKRPDIAKEWDYIKNSTIKPEYISCGNSRKYFWICSKGHSYQASPKHRCHGTNCPYCALKIFKTGINDIKTLYPMVVKDWDYKQNLKMPEDEIAILSHKFYWKCPKGHSYIATLRAKLKNAKCTICSGKQILIGYNDLKSINPDLLKEWDYQKNDIPPESYTYLSNKKVYWICQKCGYKWKATICNRPNCPNCKKNMLLINVYSIQTGELLDSYNGIVELCKNLDINYKRQRGNITSICKRNQKTLNHKYILRYQKDDEFVGINTNEERLKKIQNYINNDI